MKWLIIACIILFFFLILIIVSKITIYLNFYHHKDNDDLKIEIRLWFGLIRIKKHIPLIKVDNNSPSIIVKESEDGKNETNGDDNVSKITKNKLVTHFRNVQEILEHVVQLNIIIKSFLKKVSIKKLEWHSTIGIGDAVYTGVAAGTIWAIKGSIVGILSRFFKLTVMPNLMVQPNFQQMITSTDLSCMFQFRIGYAMLAGIKLIKWWKGGLPHLKQNKLMTS